MKKTCPPRKAILLAAGFGTRMVPLSYDLPKAMMPLWGIPVLEHIVRMLQRTGVTDILINLHHHPQPIVDWCRRQSAPTLRLQLSFEPEILGTGGALRRASHFIGREPFWMINTDIAMDLDPAALLADFRRHSPLAVLWMHDTRGPRTVEMTPDGRITNFASATPTAEGTFTFCGMQLLRPDILSFLPENAFCSVVDGYRRALDQGVPVHGCCVPGAYWADLGTPERYLEAHREIAEARRQRLPGAALLAPQEARRMRRCIPASTVKTGFVAVGRDVRIPSGTTLTDCVLWDGVRLHSGSRVADSIAGSDTDVQSTLQGSVQVRASILPADPVLDAALHALHATRTHATVTALPARGSDRSFQRLCAGRRRAILIRYDDRKREENARYAGLAAALSTRGIRVPSVILDMPEQKATLFEDAGTLSLQDALPGMSRQKRRRHYRQVIEQLAALHRVSPKTLPPLEPPFTAALYRWEHELFANHFLRDTLHMPADQITQALSDLAPCARILLQQSLVPVHRDFQSSNILLRNGQPVLIDFQGLRLGAAAYDLASLLCDPYVMLDAADRADLLAAYCSLSPDGVAVRSAFVPAAVQRLAQALGAFGRLSANAGTHRFARYIAPAVDMLKEVLNSGGMQLSMLSV